MSSELATVLQRIEGYDAIVNQYRALLGDDDKLARHDADVHEPAEIRKTVERLQEDARALRIGIIGKMKAGKSSLLNAYLFDGADVLPKAATPMTAALTILSYAQEITVRPEFFTREDMEVFRRKHDEYQALIEAIVLRMEEEDAAAAGRDERGVVAKARPSAAGSGTGRTPQQRRMLALRRAAEKSPDGAAAHDHWVRAQKAGGMAGIPDAEHVIGFGTDFAKMTQGLGDYVGAQGKYVYFTKCLHLGLPIARLQGLEIVDTPGLNDPIVSREHRTQQALKTCDAVFIVSPAGQFLTSQDMELLDRLNTREGVCEIYVVASQFDNLLHGRDLQQFRGELPAAMDHQKKLLAKQAATIFSEAAQERPEFRQLVDESALRVLTTSAVCHAMLKPMGEWSGDTQHAYGNLKKGYADYFSSRGTEQKWAKDIAGIELLSQAVEKVRAGKKTIFARRISDYLGGQEKAGRAYGQALMECAQERRKVVEGTSIAAAERQVQAIEKMAKEGVSAADEEFAQWIEGHSMAVIKEVRQKVKETFDQSNQETSDARRTEGRTSVSNNPGFFGWLGRATGLGGTTRSSYTVKTINTHAVRKAVNTFRDFLEKELNILVLDSSRKARVQLEKSLIGALRNVVNDENVRPNDVRRSVRVAMLRLGDLPYPRLPGIPEAFAVSGNLEGSEAESFEANVYKYLEDLKKVGNAFADDAKKQIELLGRESLGGGIFGNLRNQADELKRQLADKRTTLEQYKKLMEALRGVA